MKIRQKRQTPLEKAWYILQPFVIYLVAKTIGMLVFSAIFNYCLSEEIRNTYSSLVNSLASIFGVAFVMKDFLIEVCITGEVDIDANGFKRFFNWLKLGAKENTTKLVPLGACVSLGISAALALNILIELISVSSDKYDNVETIQYAVPLWLGIILYGLVSPWVEEIVFRGLTFNRMKRYYSLEASVLVTALIFGLFHANLPQFIYGTIMGVIMALVYEWVGTFAAPILFHMSANLFVFIFTYLSGQSRVLINPVCFVVFAIISVCLTIYLIMQHKGSAK